MQEINLYNKGLTTCLRYEHILKLRKSLLCSQILLINENRTGCDRVKVVGPDELYMARGEVQATFSRLF
jgi:hypothetical protein